MSSMRWRLLLRQARSSLGTSLVLVIIVAVTAAVFTAWPRLERETFAGEISHQISTTPPTLRALTATSEGIPVTTEDQWASWDEQITELIADAGPEIAAGTATPRTSVTTQRLVMTPEHGKPDDLWQVSAQVRVDAQIEDYVTVTDGAAPAPVEWPTSTQALWEAIGSGTLEPAEVMLSEQTAERVGLAVGDTFTITSFDGTLPFLVSGVFTATDPEADQWQFQLNTLNPRIDDDPNKGESATAIGYLNPASTGWIGELSGLEPETELWVPVQPSAAGAQALTDQLRTLTVAEHQVSVADGSMSVEMTTGLTDVLDRAIDRWQGTAAVLAMVAAGPIGVALAILALAARLAVARREMTLALAHARGASPRQLRGVLGVEGAILGLPAAALGAAAATVAIPGAVAVSDYTWALLAGLAPAVFLAAAQLPNLRARRSDLALRSASRWRWVLEIGLLALTAAAVYLVLTRGVTDQGGTDPIAAAVPLLLAVGVCVLTVRLLPLPLRALHAAARRRRGLSAFLGSARTIREGGLAMVPLFALVVGTTVAVFATTMITTLQQGTDAGRPGRGRRRRPAHRPDVQRGGSRRDRLDRRGGGHHRCRARTQHPALPGRLLHPGECVCRAELHPR
ncbi:FtsX-like permease family protein [Ruania zhangjianzhongii]|uniref:FtsX-like permease family protein n=1 Tax=Ruania zhangjianzhongii TaxID=2603206 RepID=UPI0011CA1524|nr:FtsX-like permease family protein [Ruania zhangjianzhongii]